MASSFSSPIRWVAGMNLSIDSENQMSVSLNENIDAMAVYDGLLIYRPSNADKGNVELVFFPNSWDENLKISFDKSMWTELPPGRIVYHDVSMASIKDGLHKLISESYKEYKNKGDPFYFPVLDYIPDKKERVILLYKLEKIWNEFIANEIERESRINSEINKSIETFLKNSSNDSLDGVKVRGGDIIFSLGDGMSKVELKLEIRNLYGEPLNPHFYLRRLGENPTDLAPVPPFPTAPPDDADPPARIKPANGPLQARIPRIGGTEFSLYGYKSRLVWFYESFDSRTNAFSAGIKPREGANVYVPIMKDQHQWVQNIWEAYYPWINKYAFLFQVPCEILLGIIAVESRKANLNPDLHSIRLEPLEPGTNVSLADAEYPANYEALIARTRVPGAKLNKPAVEAYWKAVGGWATGVDKGGNPDLRFRPRHNEDAEKKKVEVNLDSSMNASSKLGKGYLENITWEQLNEIAIVNPNLLDVSPLMLKLPTLQKNKEGKYHYDLIRNAAMLGEDVARIYWLRVGCIRMNLDKEEARVPTGLEIKIPIPPDFSTPCMEDPDNAALKVTWGQILKILKLIDGWTTSISSYNLKPLSGSGSYLYDKLRLTQGLQIRLPRTDDLQIDDMVHRYEALMNKSIRSNEGVGPGNLPGIELDLKSPPVGDYLTLEELKLISKILPEKISIGIGQCLFETAVTRIIPWIKNHYGDNFFSLNAGVPKSPEAFESLVDWIWDNVWDNVELQILMLAGYVKRNAVYFWQGFKKYRIGDRMTMLDFPRVVAAYNAGEVKKPNKENSSPNNEHYSDWGLHQMDYLGESKQGFAAFIYAASMLSQIASNDTKAASVRLRPDIEAEVGMDPR